MSIDRAKFIDIHKLLERRMGPLKGVYKIEQEGCPNIYEILNSPNVEAYLKRDRKECPKLERGQIIPELLNKRLWAAREITQQSRWQREEFQFCGEMQTALNKAEAILKSPEQEKGYWSWLESKYATPKIEVDEPFDRQADREEKKQPKQENSSKEKLPKPFHVPQPFVVLLALVSAPIVAVVVLVTLSQLFRSNPPL